MSVASEFLARRRIRAGGHHFWLALAAVGLMSAVGCGGTSDEDLEVAERSVRAGLDGWKRGEQPAVLKQLEPPIEFHDDDWQAGAQLIDFDLRETYRDSAGTPRCAVELTLRQSGKEEKRRIVYEAKVGSTIVVARDPYS